MSIIYKYLNYSKVSLFEILMTVILIYTVNYISGYVIYSSHGSSYSDTEWYWGDAKPTTGAKLYWNFGAGEASEYLSAGATEEAEKYWGAGMEEISYIGAGPDSKLYLGALGPGENL